MSPAAILVQRCAWCSAWLHGEPAGVEGTDYEVSHGVCEACAERVLREMEG